MALTYEQKQEIIRLESRLIRALTQLAEGKVPMKEVGICGNLNYMLEFRDRLTAYTFVSELSVNWKYHSGRWSDPIPNNDYYYGNKTLWIGKEAVYRYNLCRYLLAQVKTVVNNENN
jgi:hypothetical protein